MEEDEPPLVIAAGMAPILNHIGAPMTDLAKKDFFHGKHLLGWSIAQMEQKGKELKQLMDELKEKVITALTKQVELLQESGASLGDRESAARIIATLSELLRILA